MNKLKNYIPLLFLFFLSFDVNSQLLNVHARAEESKEIAIEWLDLLESGNYKKSFEMLSPIFKANLTSDGWAEINSSNREQVGKLLSRKFKRIVPYQDPPNSPLPGLYIAVEFDSVYEKASKHFQYIILHSQNSEPFKVMRHEVTQLTDG